MRFATARIIKLHPNKGTVSLIVIIGYSDIKETPTAMNSAKKGVSQN